MIGESEVADASGFALFQQEVQHAVVQKMCIRDSDKGEWVLINGNQTCLIFLYYIIKNRIALGKMQPNDFIVKRCV